MWKTKAPTVKKIIIVLVIIGLIAAFKVFNLGQYLSFSYLKESRDTLVGLYEKHTALVITAYFFIYVITTSLSLPGASPLTIVGGAVMGFWVATLVVSFASTIGATLACFFSRFLLRDWVQNKIGNRIKKVNEGIEKEGSFYLFTLRLIPLFPFWMINLAMGLTKMPLKRYYWVSQIGMLPGTMLYVNAGKELGKIDSPAGILSPSLIISFALIGIFPLVVKKLVAWYRSRREKKAIEK
jgi:uncharacterized membrane protein YdjX (TVP38/TMEM64 family)